jgi:hypothetical protein
VDARTHLKKRGVCRKALRVGILKL